MAREYVDARNVELGLTHTGTGNGFMPDPLLARDRLLNAVLAAALASSSIGSGGVASLAIFEEVRTGPLTVTRVVREADEQTVEPSIAGRITLIRRWLSLSVAEVARVLRVQRPTVYAWQAGQIPNRDNQKRVQAVFEIGRTWRSLSAQPLGARRKLVPAKGEENFVDVLSRESVDRAAAVTRLAALAGRASPTRQASAASLAAKYGFSALSADDHAANIARETSAADGDSA